MPCDRALLMPTNSPHDYSESPTLRTPGLKNWDERVMIEHPQKIATGMQRRNEKRP
jgi:hypothetical protein